MKQFKEFAQVNEMALKPLPDRRREPLDEEAPVVNDETQFAFKEGTYEFTDLAPKQTGLPFTVWIQPSLGAEYGVRIAISSGDEFKRDWVLVMIEPGLRVVRGKMGDEDLVLLRQWVNLNRAAITRFWNDGETDSNPEIFHPKPLNQLHEQK